ncbi:MAG: winged helix-turn-helix domain-containing protein [Candidatus Saccharimonadales bacterium]
MLDAFITSKTRRKIVILFSKYPDYQTHIRGMAKLIREDAGNIQRELRKLEEIGFLKSRKKGNTKIYSANQKFPLFKELQSMVLKSQHYKQS